MNQNGKPPSGPVSTSATALLPLQFGKKTTKPGKPGKKPTNIKDAFQAFNAANPHVYTALCKLAREWKRARPGKPVGMKALWERLRWEMNTTVVVSPGSEFSLNNNFTSLYARLLMEKEPDLVGLFETRELAADR